MILQGDWIEQLKTLADESVQCCVTSPPYWGLRSYLPANHALKPLELGQEKTPQEYVAKMVEGFREVRRVLKPDGTLWLNLADSYSNQGKRGVSSGGKHVDELHGATSIGREKRDAGLKPKDLVGIPWRVAFALQADGWYLRSDIIWAKPNPMPESVTDRPTKAHEYIFLMSKSERYYYNAAAIRNPPSSSLVAQVEQGYNGHAIKDFESEEVQNASATKSRIINGYRAKIDKQRGHSRRHAGFNDRWDKLSKDEQMELGSNKRTVWEVATSPFKGSHFATFPPELIRPCILAGSRQGDSVLDPFGGSGTVGQVCKEQARNYILIELNADYVPLIQRRLAGAALNFQEQELFQNRS